MPYVQPEITCNLQWRHTTRQMAYAKQGDYNSRKVSLLLYNGSNRFTWADNAYTAEFAYKRSDGHGRAYSQIDGNSAIALNAAAGAVTVLLEPEVLAVAGMVECELRLLTEGSRIATFTFGYFVEKAVVDDSTPTPSPTPTPTPTPTGSKTKLYGFASVTDYTDFVAENPGVLTGDDIVIITSTSGSDTVHTFYSVVQESNATISLSTKHTITVPSGSGGGSVPSGGWATSDIADGAITTAKLASSAVTAAKIGSGAVTEAKIGSGAVTSGKIGSSAVTEAKLGAGAVTNAKIGSGAVTTDKLSKLVVEITEQNGGYTPSYNFNEVRDAIVANKKVEILFHGFTGDLIFSDSSTAIFDLVDATDPAIPIKYQFTMNGLNVTAADISRYVPNPASGTALSPSTDKDKVPTVDEYGNFVLRTPSGGGGGGGISLTVFYAVVDTTNDPVVSLYDSSNNPVSYNDYVAARAGAVRIITVPNLLNPNDGWEWYPDDMAASSNFISIHAILPGQGTNTLYTAELAESNGILTGPMYAQTIGKGNAMLPIAQSKTATNMSNGFSVTQNYIYTVSGECSGFAVTNQSIAFTTGLCAEIILTVGSTAISSPTWPSAAKFMDGWDGKFSANTEYDIIIDWAGRVYRSERAVSA